MKLLILVEEQITIHEDGVHCGECSNLRLCRDDIYCVLFRAPGSYCRFLRVDKVAPRRCKACLLEFVEGKHPRKHFHATDDVEHVRRTGDT